MSTATTLRSSSLMAILLLASLFVTLGSEKSAKESSPSACADELVRFSPCLSYVASAPNNLSDSPTSKCCEAFSSAADSGRAVCLCYLVQDPLMLGFPVTVARVLSLSSIFRSRNFTTISTFLQSLCSESPELPPLCNTTISVISCPPPSGYETAKTNKQVKHKTKLLNSTELSSRTSKNAIIVRGHEMNFQEQHFLVSTCHIGFHTHPIIELQPGSVFLTFGGILR